MSITAGIDFSLGEPIGARELIAVFDKRRWDFAYEGLVLFLEPSAYEDMGWNLLDPPTEDNLIETVCGIEGKDGGFGFTAVHRETGVGGQFLVDTGGKKIIWNITINRPYIDSERLIDYTLCLRAVWEAVGKFKHRIVLIEYMQTL